MTDLLSLALRCEAADGPSRELDALIWWIAGDGRATVPQKETAEAAIGFYYGYEITGPNQLKSDTLKTYRGPSYTSSLDAAMTLVPEGWSFSVGRGDTFCWATVEPYGCDPLSPMHHEVNFCRTPALALCAAALRARAQEEQG